jgi:hypothetical protein
MGLNDWHGEEREVFSTGPDFLSAAVRTAVVCRTSAFTQSAASLRQKG